MKLLLENWRRFLNEEWDDMYDSSDLDFKVDHNLFVDYIQNELVDEKNPELVDLLRKHESGKKINPKVNQRMHQKYKLDFTVDVAPTMDCRAKLAYLDRLVSSYFNDPEPYKIEADDPRMSDADVVEENVIDPSPYRVCRDKIRREKSARSSAAKELANLEEKNNETPT